LIIRELKQGSFSVVAVSLKKKQTPATAGGSDKNSRNSSTVGKAARLPKDRHFNAATALPSFMHVSKSSRFSMP